MPLIVDPAKDITIGATTLRPAPHTVNPKMATSGVKTCEGEGIGVG